MLKFTLLTENREIVNVQKYRVRRVNDDRD